MRSRHLIRLNLAILGLAVAVHGQAANLALDTAKGDISFLAVGRPSALKIRGTATNGLSGNLEFKGDAITGTAKFKLSELSTHIDLRDNHMKNKYLEVEKYPHAELKITQLSVPKLGASEELSLKEVPFEGELTLHGQTKPVKGTANIEKKQKNVDFTTSFSVNVTDFGIEIPSYLGIKVTDKVDVTALASGTLN